jgi:hypothetical protein
MPSMNRHVLVAGLLALVAVAPAATAAPRFEVTPFAGYRTGGEFDTQQTADGQSTTVDLEDGSSWGIDLGLYRDSNSFYELLYATQSTSLDSRDPLYGGIDIQTDYYQFGGTIFFADEQWLIPYLSLTAGVTRFSADGGLGSETKFSTSLGGGLRLPFGDNFAATLGLRGYLTFVESDTDFFCVGGGGEAGCLLKSSGGTYFQGEALLGLTFRF